MGLPQQLVIWHCYIIRTGTAARVHAARPEPSRATYTHDRRSGCQMKGCVPGNGQNGTCDMPEGHVVVPPACSRRAEAVQAARLPAPSRPQQHVPPIKMAPHTTPGPGPGGNGRKSSTKKEGGSRRRGTDRNSARGKARCADQQPRAVQIGSRPQTCLGLHAMGVPECLESRTGRRLHGRLTCMSLTADPITRGSRTKSC